MGALAISKLVSDIIVKRNICKPMWRSEAVRQIAMCYHRDGNPLSRAGHMR